MTYRAFVFILLGFFILTSGCKGGFLNDFKSLDYLAVPPHKSKLVVFANLQSTLQNRSFTDQYIYVGKTRNALDSAQNFSRNDSFYRDSSWYHFGRYGTDTVNAKVDLYKNGKLFSTPIQGVRGNFNEYLITEKMEADGATFKLRVSAAGFETVEVEQTMPNLVKLDSVKFLRKGLVISGINYFTNAYELLYYFKDSVSTKANYYTAYANLPFYVRIKNLDLSVSGDVFSDADFNGKNIIWKVFYDNIFQTELQNGYFYLNSTTRDAYLFEQSEKQYYETRNNKFAEPTTLYSNIKNGYGIFTLSAVSQFYLRL